MKEDINSEDLGQELIDAGFGIDVESMEIEQLTSDDTLIRIFSISDNVERERYISKLRNRAQKLQKTRSFNNVLKAFQQSYIQEQKRTGAKNIKFTDCPLENLKCGEWECDDTGVSKIILGNNINPIKVVACSHPILPVERLINIDTNTEKVKLAFYKDKKWQDVIVEKNTIASKSKILQLANRGIEVNENNAKELITYLADVINLNIDTIPYSQSITHLGWINNKEFSPYATNYKYDGDIAYKTLYQSVKTKGDYTKWKECMRDLRRKSIPLRFMMAASFASILVNIFKINPFMVHLWGKSGNGKTVAQMVCASIWGNPAKGKLLSSFDNTKVASERMLNFLRSIPLFLDELQLTKKIYKDNDSMVYALTEGKGKDRGTVDNGLTNVTEWDNIIITSGEEPITGSNSKEGVKNRVFEIEENGTIIENGNEVVKLIQENYGYAGREFVEIIKNTDDIFEQHKNIFTKLEKMTDSKKQLNAMACILLADKITSEVIFEDENLKLEKIKEYFTKDVDEADRIYNLIIDWFYQNINKFYYDSNITNSEIWGNYKKENDEITEIYVIPKVIREFLSNNNINFDGIKNKLFEKGYIEKNITIKRQAFTFSRKINGATCQCIKIIVKIPEKEIDKHFEDIPF